MIRRLLQLNGFAIVGVVLFHSAGMGFVAMFAWAHRYLPPGTAVETQIGTPGYIGLRILEQASSFSLAAFLFVSGFFVAVAVGKTGQTLPWTVVFSRIKSLLIPYLIWSVIILFLQITLEGKRFTPGNLAIDLLLGKTNEIYYYVPLLVQFYLIAPILVWLARRNWQLLLGITGLIQLLITLLPYPLFLSLPLAPALVNTLENLIPKWFFLSRLFWFVFGIVAGFQLELYRSFFYKYRWAVVGIILVVMPVAILEWEFYFQRSGVDWLANRETLIDLVYFLGMLGILPGILHVRLPFERTLETLGKDSYGIYLTHSLFIGYLARLIYRFMPQLLDHQLLLQPLFIIAGLAFPVGLMYMVDHSPARRFYKTLFG